jgi:hypothetical protein
MKGIIESALKVYNSVATHFQKNSQRIFPRGIRAKIFLIEIVLRSFHERNVFICTFDVTILHVLHPNFCVLLRHSKVRSYFSLYLYNLFFILRTLARNAKNYNDDVTILYVLVHRIK